MNSLSTQFLVNAPPKDKIRLSMMSLATVDALGGPVEFKPRGTFKPVGSMRENRNFGLPPGTWTDDTSLSLCLAHSLSTSNSPKMLMGAKKKGGFSESHQLDTYLSWYRNGFLSCTGSCFDIGNATRTSLGIWEGDKVSGLQSIKELLATDRFRGNGSLMRVLPIGLAYWSLGEDRAMEFARRSSLTTHPDSMCQEACEIYTRLIVTIMSHSASGEPLTKLDLLQQLSHLSVRDPRLRDSLCVPALPPDDLSIEDYYMNTHPLLKIANRFPPSLADGSGIPAIPPANILPSSGYVLHTLVAALYSFFVTDNFHTGALLTVNMGGDADTVGAVYGGLAGAWYSSQEDEIFWSKVTREWMEDLRGKDILEKVIEEFAKYEEKVRSKQASVIDV